GGCGFPVGGPAAVFGLLGGLVFFGRRTGSRIVGGQAQTWGVGLFLFGVIFRGVDNWAHLGGFVGGYAAAKFLDPLQPERLDHLVAAFACLALTAIAIMFSIVTALGCLRI